MAATVTQTKLTTNANAFETDAIEALTFDTAVSSGFVVVVFWVTNSAIAVSSVVDNGSGGSNTYALLSQGGVDAAQENSSASTEAWIYGAEIANQMTTATVTLSGAVASPGRMAIFEIDGQHATTPVEDVAVANNGASPTTSHPVGPVVTANAGNVLIGVITGSNGIYQNESGWTSLDSVTNGHIAYRTIDAASTTWTPTTSGNESTASVLVAIQPDAGGGEPEPPANDAYLVIRRA